MYVRPAAAAAAAFLGFTLTVLGGTASSAATGPASGPATGPGAGSGALPWLSTPVVYAHRGASAYAPENTLESIDLAMRLGFDWVENDVQRTKDGELVVIHDDTLSRTTDVEQVFPNRSPWRVKDFTAAEIARLDAGSWFDEEFTGARVPTLRQYLARVQMNRQRLLLEIKKPELYPGIEEQTLDVLDAAGWLDERHVARRLVVQSFSADSVRVVHSLRPDLVTAFLGTPTVADLPRYAAFTDRINPWHTTISADWVAAVHRTSGAHGKAMEVDTWIVDDPATARKVQDMGVDGIISNAPDVVREAVGGF
ncbi:MULTISPECIES: glycerophosphodiester phosphodiesterase family protein [unclassified Streptomyces]|uniref:glycerophosphodiester phosphodiesterase n=1 Tax=unclassified Streptomyces TaxID=2593676 RepID=UPI001BE95BF0|nr:MULTISPECIES: glycerophosphodiester phosphodiesterase family protein [unclassified Streptomyces]MBT2402281.1 glycerophosphodiester phosphodiesterase [Streptomyces sp. ISL-21]MBT2460087.1 glycerophosphodiester phosphodiesterase [Streptomyces sp. ISL-86]MBT2606772.1 glycerophosphodiester phosphodiesterase [Streptomyces sp. ISL-87]